MSFRWSEETTFKFVSKYLEHECLWNIKSSHYKNKQIKQSAYMELENTINIPGFGEKEIKLKIKNVRSTYSQELKKIKESKNSGAGSDTVYIPSVKWFSLLDASLRNVTSMLTESESNLASDSSHTDNTDTEQNKTVVETFREPESNKSTPPTKKERLSQLSSMVGQLQEIAETANSATEDNEFEVFDKHVSLQLKSLPLLLALEAQEHIQVYLNRTRRQHLQNTTEGNSFISTPESPYSNASTYTYNNDSNEYLVEQGTESRSQSVLPLQHAQDVTDYQLSSNVFPSGNMLNIETQRNTTHNLIVTAMENANFDNRQ